MIVAGDRRASTRSWVPPDTAPPTQRSWSPGTGTPCGPWSTSAALASVRAAVRGRRVRACASRTELHRPARSALLPTSPSRAVSFPSCRVVPDLVGDFDGPLLQVRLLGRVGQIELEPATPDFAAAVPLKALPGSPLLQRFEGPASRSGCPKWTRVAYDPLGMEPAITRPSPETTLATGTPTSRSNSRSISPIVQ